MKNNSLASKNTFQALLIPIVILLLFSCSKPQQKSGAVVITFDDQSVDLWYKQRELFNKYNIKATFFINRPHLLQTDQIEKLLQLQKDGHEIGCHGLNHLNSVEYKDSLDFLIATDIQPAKQMLTNMGFDVVSFAYPYGSTLPEIDSVFVQYFKYLRKATYNIQDTTIDYYDDIFVSKNNFRISDAMGIDTNYKISLESFETGLKRAKKNNEALILYAHRIDTTLNDYSIHPEYLENIFQLCNKFNVKSIRFRDVNDFITSSNNN